MTIILPASVVPRWQSAIRNERLIEWRALAFLLSAEAKMAQVEKQHEMESDLLALFEVAMQHVYNLQPGEAEA